MKGTGEGMVKKPVIQNCSCFVLFCFQDFLMWTVFKVFIEFVTILFLFYVLWDLSYPTMV